MILVELVPHSLAEIKTDAQSVLSTFPVDGINVPDVLRVPIRSYDAAISLIQDGKLSIPHIRCIDHPLHDTVSLIERYYKSGLKQVLIISGDKPKEIGRAMYDISPIQVIRALRKTCPDLKIYCGLDPYRSSMKEELSYCNAKLEVGANGFFTQPFFDVDFAKIYLNQLTHTEVFLGISPVTSERSLNYWITVNNVVFPPQFELSLEANSRLAKQLISLSKIMNQHVYLMPIKVDAMTYLGSVFT